MSIILNKPMHVTGNNNINRSIDVCVLDKVSQDMGEQHAVLVFSRVSIRAVHGAVASD
jgi:hypothetical protein